MEYDSKKIVYNQKNFNAAGSGAHGLVIPAFVESKLIAVKCFSVHGGFRKSQQVERKVKDEMEILRLADHECVVDVFGWVQWSGAVGIVMEYLVGGNLMEMLEEGIELGMLLKLRFCKEIASGLSYIHNVSQDKRLIHGDIKPENVLLTEKLHCKIGDFGSAKIASYTGSLTLTGTEPTKKQFTFIYAAPELLNNPTTKLLPAHDIYSYSILVHVILCGENVMTNNPQYLQLYSIGVRERGERPSLSKILDLERDLTAQNKKNDLKILKLLIETMRACWKQIPDERRRMCDVASQLEWFFGQLPLEELEKRVTTITRDMGFQKPSWISSECRPLNRLQLQHATSVNDLPISSLCSRSTSEPSTASDAVLAPRRSNSVLTSESTSTITGLEDSSLSRETFQPAKSPSPRRQMSAVEYRDFLTIIHAIKSSLKSEKRNEAVAHCKALEPYDVSIIPDKGKLSQSISLLASTCGQEVANWEIFFHLIHLVLKMCDNLTDSKEKLNRVVECEGSVRNLSKNLYRKGHTQVIKEQCLPKLKLCLKKLGETPNENDKEKSRHKTLCLLHVGKSYCYIGRYEKAVDASESCLTIMEDAYGREAKDYRVYAMSYELKADACHALGKRDAAELYQRAINMMKSANDTKDKNKEEWFQNVTAASKTQYSPERVWKYVL